MAGANDGGSRRDDARDGARRRRGRATMSRIERKRCATFELGRGERGDDAERTRTGGVLVRPGQAVGE